MTQPQTPHVEYAEPTARADFTQPIRGEKRTRTRASVAVSAGWRPGVERLKLLAHKNIELPPQSGGVTLNGKRLAIFSANNTGDNYQ